ncbi:MAG: hypothetical protein M1831_000001 [Alyxoria varia]|nr:MAG: hypothetical protein M1831_000001 [Alyxoria varia]
MFRKKRATTSPNPSNPNPTPSAASAAAQAFIKQQTQDAKLSNAAAAAALRSHSTSPTPISDLQTKRMLRKGSTSSAGSDAAVQRPGLQRHGSNGSLTQRSFRSPTAQADDIPPVPALPGEAPQISNDSKDASISASSTSRPPEQALQVREESRPASKAGDQSGLKQSIWSSTTQNTPPAGNRKPNLSLDSPHASPKSINFSRPMSPSNSPQSPRSSRERVKPMASSADAAPSPEGPISSRPVPRSSAKNKAIRQPLSSTIEEGKHLSARSMHPPPSGSMLDSLGPSQVSPGSPSSGGSAHVHGGSGNGAVVASKESQAATNGSTTNSSKKKSPRSGSDSQSFVAASAPSSQLAATPAPSSNPTLEQIKIYQSRATAMLARPLTNDPSPEPVSTRRSEDKPQMRTLERPRNDEDQKRSELQPIDHRRAVSQPVPNTIGRTMSLGRAESISPARSAHFLDSPQVEGSKHQPPPRSVSPVKSAMKTPSPRNISPEILHGRALSDHSDSRSLVSEESSTIGASKKKKIAHVSFEDNAVKVGEAAEGGTVPESEPLSPQFRTFPREVETGIQEISMAPRPELPSFGSIRGRKVQEGGADNRTFTDFAPTTKPNPEGSEENPDDEEHMKAQGSHHFAEDTPNSREKEGSSLLAPTIAVQPATPRVEEPNEFEAQSYPSGDQGFETNGNDSTTSGQVCLAPDLDHGLQSDANTSQTLQAEESSSDSDSGDSDVFSDAAEDPSEVEDPAGFASLDAIVESPMGEVAGHTKAVDSSSEEPSPVEAPTEAYTDPNSGTAPQDGWEDVRAYWNSLSEQRKAEIEREARAQKFEAAHKGAIDSEAPKDRHSSTAVVSMDKSSANSESTNKASTPATRPLKPALKKAEGKSPREHSKPEQIHLRRSMRSSGTMHRSSMSEASSSAAKPLSRQTQRQNRPVSADPQSAQQLAVSINASSFKAQNGLRDSDDQASKQRPRRNSNDSSASDSSFKRKRRDSTSTTGSARYTMRRSMRSSSPPPLPTNSLASPPIGFTRKSLRHSERDPHERPKSSSGLFGFAKSSKPGKPSRSKNDKPKGSSLGSSSRFQSRFDDSSGDEDHVRHEYSSRFPDSDESGDDVPAGLVVGSSSRRLAPLRGIPRRAGQEDGDSTDLSDSEEQDLTAKRSSQKKKEVGPNGRPATSPAQDALSLAKISDESPAGRIKNKRPPQSISDRGLNAKPNGSTSDSPLNVGTLRKSPANTAKLSASESGPKDSTVSEAKKSSNRRSFFGFGKKRQSAQPGLLASKWAPSKLSASTPSPPVAVTSSPTTQETQTNASSLPSSPHAPASRNSSSKLLRRMSRDTSTVDPTQGQHSRSNTIGTSLPASYPRTDPHGFPFPPPPIPEEYKDRSGGINPERPQTSNGLLSTEAAGKTNGMQAKDWGSAERPGMNATAASTASVPVGLHVGESSLGRDEKDYDTNARPSAQVNRRDKAKEKGSEKRVVFSERTGKLKKFQGLRRVFGLND